MGLANMYNNWLQSYQPKEFYDNKLERQRYERAAREYGDVQSQWTDKGLLDQHLLENPAQNPATSVNPTNLFGEVGGRDPNDRWGANKQTPPPSAEGTTFEAPSDIDRWRMQINAMMKSGNPILMKQAMSEMNPHQQRRTAVPTDTRTGDRKNWMAAIKDGSFKGTFVEWMDRYKNTGTNVSTYVDTANKTISKDDAASMRNKDGELVDVPVGMTYAEAYNRGWTYSNIPSGEEARRGAFGSVAADELVSIRDGVKHLGEQGRNFITGILGNIDTFREKSTPEGQIFNAVLDLVGVKQDPENAKIRARLRAVNATISRMLTGLDMPKHEVESLMAQLPNPEQPDAVFFANIDAQLQNMIRINELIRKARGQGVTIPTIDIGENPNAGRPNRNDPAQRARGATY